MRSAGALTLDAELLMGWFGRGRRLRGTRPGLGSHPEFLAKTGLISLCGGELKDADFSISMLIKFLLIRFFLLQLCSLTRPIPVAPIINTLWVMTPDQNELCGKAIEIHLLVVLT